MLQVMGRSLGAVLCTNLRAAVRGQQAVDIGEWAVGLWVVACRQWQARATAHVCFWCKADR